MTGSNRRPSACKADALPAELILLNGDPYGNRTHVTAVKGRCLNRLTNGPNKIFSSKLGKKIALIRVSLATSYSHRGKPPTTISAEELNFRVRYGNGCDLFAIITGLFSQDKIYYIKSGEYCKRFFKINYFVRSKPDKTNIVAELQVQPYFNNFKVKSS